MEGSFSQLACLLLLYLQQGETLDPHCGPMPQQGISLSRSDSGNQVCSQAGRMSAQDKVQRFKIASLGSKLAVFTAAIIKGIFSIIIISIS